MPEGLPATTDNHPCDAPTAPCGRSQGATSTVTTIGCGDVNVGDVVEVHYLYIVNPAAPRLFQPRILRSRTDIAPTECHLAQLANAATDRAVK